MDSMETMHEVKDEKKVETLMDSMETVGWRGAPLVRWDNHLLTGVHRYEAALRLDWSKDDIPMVDIANIFAEAGLDFDALHAEHGYPTATDYYELAGLLGELPLETRDNYGIDLH